MDVVVCVKQVLDTRLTITIDGQGEVAQGEPRPVHLCNPADRGALEEAVRLRRRVGNCRVTAITLGPPRAEAVLAHCLARGVDQAVHVLSDESGRADSFSVARVLSGVLRARPFDLILCGNRSVDDGSSEVGPVLAELLDIAQVTNVVKLEVSAREKKLVAERKLERGYRQVVEADLPTLITVDASICQPRYLTVRATSYWARSLTEHRSQACLEARGLLDSSSLLRRVLAVTPPKPRTKKIAKWTPMMSAEERLDLVMDIDEGVPRKAAPRATGGADLLADEIVAFLRDKDLI